MTMIFHIVRRDSWEAALARGRYEPESLRAQGFIHCSTAAQVEQVADELFRGEAGLALLRIDAEKVAAELRYENLEGGDELFPHIYGPLTPDAVIDVVDLPVP